MRQLTEEETLSLEPAMREMVASRGWKEWQDIVAQMRDALVNQAAFSALGDDLHFVRGQLVALDLLVKIPAQIIVGGEKIREAVDEVEKARRLARVKTGLPFVLGGEVSQ